MIKIFFIFLLIIFGCSKEEFKQPEIQSIFENSQPEPVLTEEIPEPKLITTKEAEINVGNKVILRGFVASVTEREKVAYLNFDKKYPDNTFTCVIFAKNLYKFDKLKNYEKKVVEVTGKINVFNGKPQIILDDSEQIKIIK